MTSIADLLTKAVNRLASARRPHCLFIKSRQTQLTRHDKAQNTHKTSSGWSDAAGTGRLEQL